MTYLEKSHKLALDSSVAVLALSNPECTDIEFLPLRPTQMSASDRVALAARWSGRNLRSVGVIGLVGTSPHIASRDPLDSEQVTALAGAFLAYLHVLFSDTFAEQREGVEIQELQRMWSIPDTRFNA